jgi:hypothetical protein
MNLLEQTLSIVFALIFVVWVICMVSWVKRGMPIPRYIHYLAVALTLAGGVFVAFALAAGLINWKLGLACLALPAPATYIGWLWFFGPEFSSRTQDTTRTSINLSTQTNSEQDAALKEQP